MKKKNVNIISKRSKILREEFVKSKTIEWLNKNGWSNYPKYRSGKEKGVDIRVCNNRYGTYFLIEVKGQSTNRSGDETGFIYSLGQIITRMNVNQSTGYRYGIALPHTIAQRALRRLPWRIAKRLRLSVFSVDSSGKVKESRWKDLKKKQENEG